MVKAIKKKRCKECKKWFTPKFGQQYFCKPKCRKKNYAIKNREKNRKLKLEYYHANKDKVKIYRVKYREENYIKVRRQERKAIKKYFENNREKFNERQRSYYKNHKDKHLARTRAYKLVNKVYKTMSHKLKKVCSDCGSRYRLWLFFDIYPLTHENIIKAIEKNKIRYLCPKHWREAARNRRLRWERKQKRNSTYDTICAKGI